MSRSMKASSIIKVIEMVPNPKALPRHYQYHDVVVAHRTTMAEAEAEMNRLQAEHPDRKFTISYGVGI